jgi:ribosomal protein S9
MKSTSSYRPASNHFILLFVVFCLVSSCSKKLKFSTSAIVPAAEGSVKINKDKNENYALSLNVRHLSAPDRLVEPRSLYVVWIYTNDRGVLNMGQLKSGHGLFSKALTSSLKTVTTFEPVDVFITAENEANITYPKGQVVLTTK